MRSLKRWVPVAACAAVLAAAVAGPAGAVPGGQDRGGQDRRGQDQGGQGRERAVVAWIDRQAVPLDTIDPGGPVDDLGPLRRVVGNATVVGLGESTHGSRDQFLVKQRLLRFLVERMGFRTLAFEHDFAHGVELDRFVTTGEGDLRQLVAGMSFPFWISEEMVGLLRWMRAYNQTHRDKVRFLGSDLIALRESSFDAVTAYVRRVARDRLGELERDLAPLRPRGNPGEHTQWYLQLPDAEQQRLVAAARRASELVAGLDGGPRLEREYARQHARTIAGWYVVFASDGARPEREEFVADTIGWWRRVVVGKVAYWAASFHASAASQVDLRLGGQDAGTGTLAGGRLRARMGRDYRAVGLLFGNGAISSDFIRPAAHPIGPPPPGLLDAILGRARHPAYLLDLQARAPRPVRDWREGPATMRMIHPAWTADADPAGAGYTMTVPSLAEAFDAMVYLRTTTAIHLFT